MMDMYDHSASNLDRRLSLEEVGALINEIISADGEYQKEMGISSVAVAVAHGGDGGAESDFLLY
jgi:hypothetical protein